MQATQRCSGRAEPRGDEALRIPRAFQVCCLDFSTPYLTTGFAFLSKQRLVMPDPLGNTLSIEVLNIITALTTGVFCLATVLWMAEVRCGLVHRVACRPSPWHHAASHRNVALASPSSQALLAAGPRHTALRPAAGQGNHPDTAGWPQG